MSMLQALYGPRPEPSNNSTLVIALAGATGSGKSTFAKYVADRVGGKVISFADPLRESARAAGWDGQKTPESRSFIQQHSQRDKERYGEDVYARQTCDRIVNLFTATRLLVIDDLRHYVEIGNLMKMENTQAGAISVLPLHFHNPVAELRWFQAVMVARTDKTAWAHHRSEMEWRSYRRDFEHSFCNDQASESAMQSMSETERIEALDQSLRQFNSRLRRINELYYNIELQATLKHHSLQPNKDQ